MPYIHLISPHKLTSLFTRLFNAQCTTFLETVLLVTDKHRDTAKLYCFLLTIDSNPSQWIITISCRKFRRVLLKCDINWRFFLRNARTLIFYYKRGILLHKWIRSFFQPFLLLFFICLRGISKFYHYLLLKISFLYKIQLQEDKIEQI